MTHEDMITRDDPKAEEYFRIHENIIRRANHEAERDIKVEKIMMARD